MSIVEFLNHLHGMDLRLWVEDGRLHCNGPDSSLTPHLQGQLKERKSEIIAFFEEARAASLDAAETIKPIPRDGKLALSFPQQRLWFLEQMDGPSATYNLPTNLHLDGPLNLPALELAFNEIVGRHEILRTSFPSEDGMPFQQIAAELHLSLGVVDLSRLDDDLAAETLEELAFTGATQPFDLAHGPMLRACVVRMGFTAHALLLTMHHMITDGWSVDILIREWVALYDFFCHESVAEKDHRERLTSL